jgi:excinuclease ABC subunit B
LEVFPVGSENVYVVEFWGNEVTGITLKDSLTNEIYEHLNDLTIFPAKHTVTTDNRIKEIIPNIQKELNERLKYFESI